MLEEIKGARCVMLGNPIPGKHMQPMAPQIDTDENLIYFYSDNTSELGKAILAKPADVHLCHIEGDYQACVKGSLYPHHDAATVDKFWSPVVDAWYPEGKKDPKLMMLKFIPHDAAVWATDKSFIGFMYEVAKANIKGEERNLGKMKEINL